ncbi:MAG TPA: ATP-dependent DNA helicase [Steroidobacteraceae bacterium]|nr:ATP-dependent DNA helicase [Steroidobacteraceae bacterium]
MTDFDRILGAHGPVAETLPGFKPRPAQQQMAARIYDALQSREHLLVEAGTGTGKTYAYLIPVLLSGKRVVISTGTRTLQDQLFHRDLPLLSSALGRPARVTLLKGRANYLCRLRFSNIGRQEELLRGSTDPLLSRLQDWALATRSGDLAELPELSDAHPIRPHITSTRENCSGPRCAEFSRCHVVEARRAAMEADVVVVNHHLLLADLALKEDGFGDLLPSADAVILDEAHQLPDLASEFFGVHVSSRQIETLLADARTALNASGSTAAAATAVIAEIDRSLIAIAGQLGRTERSIAWHELRETARADIGVLAASLVEMATRMEQAGSTNEIQQCIARAAALASALRQIAIPEDDEEDMEAAPVAGARTVTTHGRGFLLRLLPYEIAPRFRALLTQANNAWIFTSATLAVGRDFAHFAHRLGLEQADTMCFDSPFDYATQALLYLPKGMPDTTDPGFNDAVIRAAMPLIEAADGGAFLLFTSHRALRAAADRLRGQLSDGWPLLVQGSAPREQLLRQFRSCGHAVLLGTASFWEGVDVQGPALRLVIIDKLPFASPEDPVVRARIQFLESQGLSAFREYQLPEAVLALKQGVGRLIRSESDEGVVVICDPRMTRRSYGRVFRASLPPMTVTASQEVVLGMLKACARPREGGLEGGLRDAAS